MNKIGALHFHPKRIVWIGLFLFTSVLIITIPMLLTIFTQSDLGFTRSGIRDVKREAIPLTFSLGLKNQGPGFPIPALQEEMTFSFSPPRPDGAVVGSQLLVRMKRGAVSKRVVLPCRLDLEFEGDKLRFAKGVSPFWAELALSGDKQIEGKWFINLLGKESAGTFLVAAEESPIQVAQEFQDGSPFRALAEAHFWGQDQFKASSGNRIEIGTEILELSDADWLVWSGQKWEKRASFEKNSPIARMQSTSAKGLVLEGWDGEGHVRFAVSPTAATPFKMKAEELFSSLRIRSEKQISCTLEKQCMVLKVGDWVLKSNGRWKILRKKEERDAFSSGKLLGEFFIFDQIGQKQGQKIVQGRLFNSGRTQMLPIELAAQSTKKRGKK